MEEESNVSVNSSSVTVMKAHQFRAKATEEDLRVLSEYLLSSKDKIRSLPCEKKGWAFTYSFASNLLRERGIWEPIEKKSKSASVPDELEPMPFTLDPIPSGTKYKTRSIQISEDVAQRLKTFTDAQIGYQSKAVISQIISKGLEIYGA